MAEDNDVKRVLGYTDALIAVEKCIKNRASRGNRNEQTIKQI